ncbi:hypothetical protein [Paraburkholderia humisilvae]|uniref:hypothetical protein n=1 Tax=Paraburkholderia humisilvae TaxID=627669 RepID=UPI00158285C7|nr:hypothetical protein [Paraburkholderia humisilvae]
MQPRNTASSVTHSPVVDPPSLHFEEVERISRSTVVSEGNAFRLSRSVDSAATAGGIKHFAAYTGIGLPPTRPTAVAHYLQDRKIDPYKMVEIEQENDNNPDDSRPVVIRRTVLDIILNQQEHQLSDGALRAKLANMPTADQIFDDELAAWNTPSKRHALSNVLNKLFGKKFGINMEKEKALLYRIHLLKISATEKWTGFILSQFDENPAKYIWSHVSEKSDAVIFYFPEKELTATVSVAHDHVYVGSIQSTLFDKMQRGTALIDTEFDSYCNKFFPTPQSDKTRQNILSVSPISAFKSGALITVDFVDGIFDLDRLKKIGYQETDVQQKVHESLAQAVPAYDGVSKLADGQVRGGLERLSEEAHQNDLALSLHGKMPKFSETKGTLNTDQLLEPGHTAKAHRSGPLRRDFRDAACVMSRLEGYELRTQPARLQKSASGMLWDPATAAFYAELRGKLYRVAPDRAKTTVHRSIWNIVSPDGSRRIRTIRAEYTVSGQWQITRRLPSLQGGGAGSMARNELPTPAGLDTHQPTPPRRHGLNPNAPAFVPQVDIPADSRWHSGRTSLASTCLESTPFPAPLSG